MYIQRQVVARSLNHCCSGNATMCLCTDVTFKNGKILSAAQKKKLCWLIYVAGNNKTHFSLHIKCPIFCPIIIKFALPRQIFAQVPNIKFTGYPSRGGRADTCGHTDTHDENNMRKSPVNVGKCPPFYTLGGISETSTFRPVVNCVPASVPLRATYFPVHFADTCFKFEVLTADGDTNLPGTSKSSLVFCQTCFTPTPNTTGNIRITLR